MDSTTVAVVNQVAGWRTMLGGSGVAAVLAVLLFRLLPIIETWVRIKAGREIKHNRREIDRVPARINGNPCALHQPLMDTLEEMKEDSKQAKRSAETTAAELFGRLNKSDERMSEIANSVSWIRGKLDRD